MTNFETGESLLREARDCLLDMERAFERESWNLVVRRAQEAVELSLKGALAMMGLEYPKRHDVGDAFAQGCVARKLAIEMADLDTVREISARMARDRQPAFYMERQYLRSEAVRAREGAVWVLVLVERLAERLRMGHP